MGPHRVLQHVRGLVLIAATTARLASALSVAIPLRPQVATLQHGPLRAGGEPADGRVRPWAVPIVGAPFLWLGNEEVGLQWCLGDDYDVELEHLERQVELAPGAESTVLTVRLADHPLSLDRPLVYTLGLHPTPVRPMPRGWRAYDLGLNAAWRAAVDDGPLTVPAWAFWFQGWNLQTEATRASRWLAGYQAPGPWTQELIEKTVASGRRAFPYWHMSAAWRGAPEYRAFYSEWMPTNPPPLDFATAAGDAIGSAWRTVPSYRDWAIWRYWTSLQENPWLVAGMGGFYNDVAQGFWGVEPRPGRDGLMRSAHELLGVRELQKRMYVAMGGSWPQLVIANHQSGDTHLSQLAFAHLYVTGENYRDDPRLVQDCAYYRVLDLDSCRAELYGTKWGVPIVFLPETSASMPFQRLYASAEGQRASEHLMGLLLLHDTMVWPTNAHPLPQVRVAAVKEAFGWDDQTEYTGYWRSETLVRTEADRSPVVTGIYRRPGRALFVVLNNSDEDASVTLVPDWQALRLPAPAELVDACTAVGIPDAAIDLAALNDGRTHFIEPRTPVPVERFPMQSGRCAFPPGAPQLPRPGDGAGGCVAARAWQVRGRHGPPA
jgi:hypothetical protein